MTHLPASRYLDLHFAFHLRSYFFQGKLAQPQDILSDWKKFQQGVFTLLGSYILPSFRRVISSSAVRSMFTTSSVICSMLSGTFSCTSTPSDCLHHGH